MSKSRKSISILLIAIVIIGIFSLTAIIFKIFLLPSLPEHLQNWILLFVSAFVVTITILAGFAQITGYSLRDFSFHKRMKSPTKDNDTEVEKLTQIAGNHKAKGIGEVTGLDIQSPVIIKPGTKSTAEGTGIITATRISNNREDE
jgi:hypothetical protein